MRPPRSPILEARALCFARGGHASLQEVSLEIAAGSFTALRGEPGSGRGMLLRILGLLELPDSGDVLVSGVSASGLTTEARAELRSARFGYVFAAPFLLGALTVVENVAMPLFRISQASTARARERTDELLAFAGLSHVAAMPTGSLPLRDQHRVSVARALANQPPVILVEQFGDLLGDELAQLVELLRKACTSYDTAVVMVTPSSFTPADEDRVIELTGDVIKRDSIVAGELRV